MTSHLFITQLPIRANQNASIRLGQVTDMNQLIRGMNDAVVMVTACKWTHATCHISAAASFRILSMILFWCSLSRPNWGRRRVTWGHVVHDVTFFYLFPSVCFGFVSDKANQIT